MNDKHETLEDVLCYLECARDSLLILYGAIDRDCVPTQVALSALYGVHNHLDLIIEKMAKHLDGIPADVLEKAATAVHQQA